MNQEYNESNISKNSHNFPKNSIKIEYKDDSGSILKIENFSNRTNTSMEELEEKLYELFLISEGRINTITIKKD